MSKKKSADGSGSIRQRPDGRWEGRFTYTDDLGQKRRKSIYGGSQEEVRRQLTKITNAVDEGLYRAQKRYTLNQWFDEWLSLYSVAWKPSTKDDYKRKAERHILPALGKIQLTALTPTTIQKYVNQLSIGSGKQKPLAPKSVKNLHGILHSCLKQAVVNGLIPTNPADNTNLPKSLKPELSPIMDDDIKRFMDACETARYGRLFLVDMFTGLRQSEILGLQWADIDFEAGTIHVQRQLQFLKGGAGYLVLPTKNGKDRIVPFGDSVATILRAEQKQQSIWKLAAGESWKNSVGYVFTDESGDHLKHSNIQRHFRELRASIGLNNTRFHDLRHSCAILALQSGCSVKAVSDMLGHYSSAFTMDVYADVSKAMQEDTRNKMDAIFKAAANR